MLNIDGMQRLFIINSLEHVIFSDDKQIFYQLQSRETYEIRKKNLSNQKEEPVRLTAISMNFLISPLVLDGRTKLVL